MRKYISLTCAALLICPIAWAAAGQEDKSAKGAPNAGASATSELNVRADRRYDEMLGKMQVAVEEIAQLYGNPIFLQVFTNDIDRAAELRERIRSARSDQELRRELVDLQRKREELLNDIALKEREATRLTNRLVRQRAALDELGEAVDLAKKAVEETTR
jgi:hypothetical protein